MENDSTSSSKKKNKKFQFLVVAFTMISATFLYVNSDFYNDNYNISNPNSKISLEHVRLLTNLGFKNVKIIENDSFFNSINCYKNSKHFYFEFTNSDDSISHGAGCSKNNLFNDRSIYKTEIEVKDINTNSITKKTFRY